MKRGLEFTGFVAVAAAVHAAAWGVTAPAGGPDAGGSGGQSAVTIEASSAQMASLVAAWQRPVEVLRHSPDPLRPQPDPLPVAMPRPESPLDAPPERALTLRPDAPRAPDLPAVADRPPAAPVSNRARPDILPDIRPAIRPVARPAPERNKESPAPSPRAASPARPREIASGQAGGAAGVAQQTREAPSLSAAARQSLMAEWGGQIRARIERQKRYPRGAHATGTAQLTLTVSGSGALISVVLRQSSGDALLDRAALAAVRATRLPAKPRGLPGDSHRFNLPVAFLR